MNFIRFLFLATFCAGYVCSSPLEHIRRKRVSGNGYSAYLDDPIGNGDEDYVSDYDYNYETFSCADNRGKILLDLLCDDIVDCLDGSDEAAATCQEFDLLTSTSSASPTTETSSTTPQFSTKEVIIPVLSKVDDYGDYADCLEDEFQCLSDTSICLPKNQLCDGIDDCPEREDELGCSGITPQTKNGRDSVIHLGDTDSSVLKKTRSQLKPKISFKKPPVTSENPIHFIPFKKENDDQELGLHADYQYLDIKGEACSEQKCSTNSNENDSGAKDNERSQAKESDLQHRRRHEIEINHGTGEVILIENGLRRLLLPTTPNKPSSATPPYHQELKTVGRHSASEEQRKEKRQLQRAQLRGIVGKLLHHVGDMIEMEGTDNSEDGSHLPIINVSMNFGHDLPHNSLYSRIANVGISPVLVNLELHL